MLCLSKEGYSNFTIFSVDSVFVDGNTHYFLSKHHSLLEVFSIFNIHIRMKKKNPQQTSRHIIVSATYISAWRSILHSWQAKVERPVKIKKWGYSNDILCIYIVQERKQCSKEKWPIYTIDNTWHILILLHPSKKKIKKKNKQEERKNELSKNYL